MILKEYPNSMFYIGLLKGSYELNKNTITPVRGSTVIMYTNKQFFPGNQFFPGDQFSPDDPFDLGNAKAKVISKKRESWC
ncbi:hypothetical protein [Maribacter halichondriae]|uniref:hypothetical protein n=1 Tax=Maribacter halichondriae TaxID=2980554 RepID=UPI002358A0FA|nr:hypothetical protein [Maribacter sp. Hal144]